MISRLLYAHRYDVTLDVFSSDERSKDGFCNILLKECANLRIMNCIVSAYMELDNASDAKND
jgi:hypothetical protein